MSNPAGSPQSLHTRAFIGSLEGLRGIASLGVLLTHVAFQTGLDPASVGGALLARFDFFVAVFFALSAFLLWRKHRFNARTGHQPWLRRYYWRRFLRLMPAYWACVLVVLAFSPAAFGATWGQALAQLTMTQIYVPGGLIGGLTHLWSLCIEVAFYVALPGLVVTIGRLRGAWVRVTVIVAGAAVLSLGWPWLPGVSSGEGSVNWQIWPPSYALWFAVGMVAAELEGLGVRLRLRAEVAWPLALVVAWVAGQEWFGPLGLTHPSAGEFNLRVLAGMVFAWLIVWPAALGSRPGVLAARPVMAVGRWSYSLFLWHVAVLGLVFPVLGIAEFSGGFVPVAVATIVGSVAVAAVSYDLVERRGAVLAAMSSTVRGNSRNPSSHLLSAGTEGRQ